MTAGVHRGGGSAWLDLASELQRRLGERDPDAHVQTTVAPTGLLQLDVRTNAAERPAADALARRYEERARSICERCGDPVIAVGAGPVVTILCAHCRTEA
jgi:hypothetical protein